MYKISIYIAILFITIFNSYSQNNKEIITKYNDYIKESDFFILHNRILEAEKVLIKTGNLISKHSNILKSKKELHQKTIRVYYDYISKGDELLSINKYSLAMREYENAKRICNVNAFLKCTNEVEKGVYNSHTGIYNTKIELAENEFNKNRIEKAEMLLFKASDYRIKHNIKETDKGKFLIAWIGNKKCINFVNEGITQFKKNNFDEALKKLDKAKVFETKLNAKSAVNIDSVSRDIATAIIYIKITEAESMINKKRKKDAQDIYYAALKIQRKYRIFNNMELILEMNRLNEKIYKDNCINLQIKYHNYYYTAKQLIGNKFFLDADDVLNKSIAIKNSNKKCKINIDSSIFLKKSIEKIVYYKKMIKKASILVNANEYEKAMKLYINSIKYFKDNKLTVYKIKHKSLYRFIKTKHEDFINYSIPYFVNKKKFKKAFRLLSILKKYNYGKSRTKDTQILLAEKFAEYKYSKNPKTDINKTISKYTKNNKWYSYFINKYKDKWKRL